jgi:hypothetical protein
MALRDFVVVRHGLLLRQIDKRAIAELLNAIEKGLLPAKKVF